MTGVWRDKVIFTWEYRTFNGLDQILSAAQDLLPNTNVTSVRIITPLPEIERPCPDLHYGQINLSLETNVVGASIVANLINTRQGLKIWTMHTAIVSLIQYPELTNRDGHMIGDLSWHNQREKDHDFEKHQPQVVIVGGGHKWVSSLSNVRV